MGFGSVIERAEESASLAVVKASCSSSDHVITSVDGRPAMTSSNGARRDELAGITRARTLYAPMNDFIAPTFCGGGHKDNTDTRCGLAVSVPSDQVQPRIVVDFGLITVFEAERRKLFLWRAPKTLIQFSSSSSGVLPPQYKSSASLAITPA